MKKLSLLVSLNTEKNAYQAQQAITAEQTGRKLGVTVRVIHAQNDAIQQSQQILAAIRSSEPPDGIIMLPVGTGLEHVANVAARASIGWVVLNRPVDYLAQLRRIYRVPIFEVTIDQQEVGRIQGRQIAALLPGGGSVIYVLGPENNPVASDRLQGLQETIPSNVSLELINNRSLAGAWTEQSAYEAVNSWSRTSRLDIRDIALVAAQNDSMAMGARRALEKVCSGGERDHLRYVPFIGVDAVGPTLDWLRTGQITASVALPTTVDLAMEIFVKAFDSHHEVPEQNGAALPDSCPPLETLGGRQSATAAKF